MWCCYLIPAIFGIIVLISGQVSLTNKRKVRGVPARIIGVLLLLPGPMSFFGGVVLGLFNELLGKPLSEQQILTAAIVLVIGSFALCFLAVLVVGIVYSQPIRKPRVVDAIEVLDDRDYSAESIEPDERRQPRLKREDTRITDEPPPPVVPPDDRIQQ